MIRVLVVDGFSIVRRILVTALGRHPQIEVVGEAVDGVDAIRKIKALQPDVVTLDVEMPKMDGLAVLKQVGKQGHTAFVMVSSLTQAGAKITFDALEYGAVDFLAKPKDGGLTGVPAFRKSLYEKVLAAAESAARTTQRGEAAHSKQPAVPSAITSATLGPSWLCAIGSSCGGVQTLMGLLPAFPANFPPILITQHMPEGFTRSFASRLNESCQMEVHEAEDGDHVTPGHVYVAPGDRHMKIVRTGNDVRVMLEGGEKVSGHRPSVDAMFESLLRVRPRKTIAAILTGMGADGACAIGRLRQAGAWTLAQDEASCVVYGMPRVAVEQGGIDHTVALTRIPLAFSKLIQRGEKPVSAAATG